MITGIAQITQITNIPVAIVHRTRVFTLKIQGSTFGDPEKYPRKSKKERNWELADPSPMRSNIICNAQSADLPQEKELSCSIQILAYQPGPKPIQGNLSGYKGLNRRGTVISTSCGNLFAASHMDCHFTFGINLGHVGILGSTPSSFVTRH